MPKKLKQLYQIAGAIRDIQLELKLLESNQADIPHYIARLHEMLQLQKREWAKNYSKRALQKLDRKLSCFKYKKISPYILGRFFRWQMAAVHNISQEVYPTDTQIHNVRKRIKDILYNTKTAKKKWKAAYSETRNVPIKGLTKLAELIGDYNDDRFVLEHLGATPVNEMEKHEKETMERLKNSQSVKLNKKKKNILAATKKYDAQEKK